MSMHSIYLSLFLLHKGDAVQMAIPFSLTNDTSPLMSSAKLRKHGKK